MKIAALSITFLMVFFFFSPGGLTGLGVDSPVTYSPGDDPGIQNDSNDKESAGTERVVPENEARTIVYYFYTGKRCASCRKIEAYTREAVEKNFQENLKSGRIVWSPLNIELSENAHFMDDYQLFTKSVVVVNQKEGRVLKWKNLEKIWELLNNKAEFIDYITKEVKALSGEL